MKKKSIEDRVVAAVKAVFADARRRGQKAAQAVHASRTPEERSAAGKKAAEARWRKEKGR